MKNTITKAQASALQELIASGKAAAQAGIFPEDVSKKIEDSAEIAEQLLFDFEIDYTDWGFIDNLGEALLNFDADSKDVA